MDWEPYMGDMYTRFMNSFNLPVTYGGSGVRLKHGMSGQPCINSITQVCLNLIVLTLNSL